MEEKTNAKRKSDIPQDIIFDIFSRLPIKSLMRFKCVSKLCNFLITDPDFIDLYHSCSISCPDHRTKLFLRIWGQENFYTIDPKSQQIKACIVPLDNLDGLMNYPKFEYVKGLFCLWSACFRIAVICNPNTRETRFLPHLNVDTDLSYQCHYSLGFDPNKRRHKVLMTLYGTKKSTRQWVFTLGPGEYWREIKTIPYKFRPLMREGIYIDGVIYFFIGSSYSNKSKIEIARFSVTTEEIRTISLWCDGEREFQATIELYYSLIEIEGKLAVIYFKYDAIYDTIKLWMLQSPETEEWVEQLHEEWVEQLHEEWVEQLYDQVVLVPTISLSKLSCTNIHDNNNKEIAIIQSSKLILLYDLKEKTWRQINIEGLDYKDKIIGIYSYDDCWIYSLGRI